MTFAIATLAFLAAAWLAIVVLAETIEEYGTKVRAALAGMTPPPVSARDSHYRTRCSARRELRLQSRPALRAAA